MKWLRHRFFTKSIEDFRPLIFNPKYPYWCSGYGDDYAVVIAYLPNTEPLEKYWDDAYNVDSEERESITFTDRFPEPEWFVKS